MIESSSRSTAFSLIAQLRSSSEEPSLSLESLSACFFRSLRSSRLVVEYDSRSLAASASFTCGVGGIEG